MRTLCRDRIDFSGIVATRKEGNLKSQLGPKVDYMFLGKKSAIDPGAVWRLRNYFKRQNIGYVQPHSSSYFIVFLVKLIYPKIQIVWHDHNGLSEFLGTRKSAVVKIASRFFKGIIVVNYQLKNWAIRELHCSNVMLIFRILQLRPQLLRQKRFYREIPVSGFCALRTCATKKIIFSC
jgi:hypothetical protein